MQLPPLSNGHILRRYKRFLADVELADGRVVTAHCPNTGSMSTCWRPGAPVQVSRQDKPHRKLAWTLERVDMGRGWIGVHTGRVNPVVAEAIVRGRIPGFAADSVVIREPVFSARGVPRSRLDLVLHNDDHLAATYVEIKNVTLLQDDAVRFPDAVTERGRRHLRLLHIAVKRGHRGVIVFAVNRPEGRYFEPAGDIDPDYAATLERVLAAGVEAVAVRLRHDRQSLEVVGAAWL